MYVRVAAAAAVVVAIIGGVVKVAAAKIGDVCIRHAYQCTDTR